MICESENVSFCLSSHAANEGITNIACINQSGARILNSNIILYNDFWKTLGNAINVSKRDTVLTWSDSKDMRY